MIHPSHVILLGYKRWTIINTTTELDFKSIILSGGRGANLRKPSHTVWFNLYNILEIKKNNRNGK